MTKTLHIAIVEDDDDARQNLKDILELDHHHVTAFSSASEFIDHGSFAQVDVVLMDRRLPDGLAEDLLPQLRNLAKDADFIVITGYADINAAIAALREGVSDYLVKPVDADGLRAALFRIANRRQVERELYRQRRFAEKLLETAEAIILVLDSQGKILRANPYLLELTGYALDEVIDADWFEKFIPERYQDRIHGVFARTVQQVKTRGIINPILTKDGRECEVRWSNSTLRNADGDTAAVLCVGLDVTDYMKTQKQLLQNERLAAIGQTVAGLAHESRNALQRIQNAVELLQDELAGQPEALKDLGKIERAGSHIHDLLEEVRAFAAPVNLQLTHDSMSAIWRRAWRSLALRLEDREVTFHDPTPCSYDPTCVVSVDARRMEQVFRNLFENTLDATAGPLSITITCRSSADTIEIIVQDDGPGVPLSQRDKLFDAFATTKPTGTGLGLAICRRTLEAHGGQLLLLPSDVGAKFLIELPASRLVAV